MYYLLSLTLQAPAKNHYIINNSYDNSSHYVFRFWHLPLQTTVVLGGNVCEKEVIKMSVKYKTNFKLILEKAM